MIKALSIYAGVTVILVFIELIRISIARKKGKQNISHFWSLIFACIGAFIASYFFYPSKSFWVTADCYFGLLGVRYLLFDFLLAICRRENPLKQSTTTSSETDKLENKLHLGFFEQRAVAVALIVISLLVNHWIK